MNTASFPLAAGWNREAPFQAGSGTPTPNAAPPAKRGTHGGHEVIERKLTTAEKIRRAAPPEVVAILDAQIAADQAAIVARKRNSNSQRLAKAMPSPVPVQQPPARLQREDINDLYRARVRTVCERYVLTFERSPWSKPFRQKQANGPMWHDPEAVDKFVSGTLQNLLHTLLADELL